MMASKVKGKLMIALILKIKTSSMYCTQIKTTRMMRGRGIE
jgi:hypothetical protein